MLRKLSQNLRKFTFETTGVVRPNCGLPSPIWISPNDSKACGDLGNILPQLGELEPILCHQKASELRGWAECATERLSIHPRLVLLTISRFGSGIYRDFGLQISSCGNRQFSGMSACWLLDNILTHPTVKTTCIDLYFQRTF
jgi:hypothetical protein